MAGCSLADYSIVLYLQGTEGSVIGHFEWFSFHRYCKPGYFRSGRISRKCWQDISCRGNFHNTTPISFIKAYMGLF